MTNRPNFAKAFLLRMTMVAALSAVIVGSQAADVAAQENPKGENAAPGKSRNADRNNQRNRIADIAVPNEIVPGLPNVLLIGDSISIAYTVGVREQLAGKANVYRPPFNCSSTDYGVENLDAWLGVRKWDVIHFNFGLHDLKYVRGEGKELSDPKDPDSRVNVPLDEYENNLRQIAQRLKETGAVVIWRATTPVPAGSQGRVAGDEKRYNEVARKVIQEVGGIEIDPFDTHAESIQKLQRPANVHYTPEGSQAQAEHVAEVIAEALKSASQPAP